MAIRTQARDTTLTTTAKGMSIRTRAKDTTLMATAKDMAQAVLAKDTKPSQRQKESRQPKSQKGASRKRHPGIQWLITAGAANHCQARKQGPFSKLGPLTTMTVMKAMAIPKAMEAQARQAMPVLQAQAMQAQAALKAITQRLMPAQAAPGAKSNPKRLEAARHITPMTRTARNGFTIQSQNAEIGNTLKGRIKGEIAPLARPFLILKFLVATRLESQQGCATRIKHVFRGA
jgi:hypothetical protein